MLMCTTFYNMCIECSRMAKVWCTPTIYTDIVMALRWRCYFILEGPPVCSISTKVDYGVIWMHCSIFLKWNKFKSVYSKKVWEQKYHQEDYNSRPTCDSYLVINTRNVTFSNRATRGKWQEAARTWNHYVIIRHPSATQSFWLCSFLTKLSVTL